MTEKTLLIADIGGTNARFALANPDKTGFSGELTLQCADFPGVDEAIRFYLDHVGRNDPQAMCLAVAGPIINQQVKLTNNPWTISAQELGKQFPSASVQLINDFTAIAQSVPFLSSNDCLTIGPSLPVAQNKSRSCIGVIGPGTGLGIAGLIRQNGQHIPITTEAGHIGFAPETREQTDLLINLRQRWQRVSIERLISGTGIENLYWAMHEANSDPDTLPGAAKIFSLALEDANSMAGQTVQAFFEILGQVTGDIALALGAEDGIYIAGGMVKRYPQLLMESNFRQAFENKGRHENLLKRIPTKLIMHPQPGLLGASYYCQKI